MPDAASVGEGAEYWNGKIAVVTGVAGPMGRTVAERLLGRGVRVCGFDLPQQVESMDLSQENFLAVAADIGEHDQIRSAFERVDEAWGGRVDLLVNIAAVVSSPDSIVKIPQEEFDRVVTINLAGTFWTCQEAARRMIEHGDGGSIVNIASLNGFLGRVQFPTHVYAASKAGVIGLTTSLAGELGAYGIRVNCVSPGLHATPLAASVAGDPEASKTFFENAAKFTPLGRVADPSEMSGPILFLLSDDASNVTGQMFASDGGRSTWYQ